jgi:alpha-galactosidase
MKMMLDVGNGGITDAQYRAHFSWWAILNKEVIAVDQDPLGREGDR